MKPLVRDFSAWLLDLIPGVASLQRVADQFFIATFHRVLPESQLREYPLPGLAVTPEQFEWYVLFFTAHFECVRLDRAWIDFSSGVRREKPILAITFDDGQLDNFLHAAPVLDAHGVVGTFFVPVEAIQSQTLLWHDRMAYAVRVLLANHPKSSLLAELGVFQEPAEIAPRKGVGLAKHWPHSERLDWIRRAEIEVTGTVPSWDGMMTWHHLRELIQAGHEIGSHSFSHLLLDQCDDQTLAKEIAESRQILRQELDQEILSFCYPNGNADSRVAEVTRGAGYQVAVTTQWGSNRRGGDPILLKRHDMVAANAMDRHGDLSARRLRQRMLGFVRGAS